MPDYTSAVYCNHANEFPARCGCPSNCYCKANTCQSPDRVADHPPQPTPTMTESDAFRILGQFPHCDHRVLHRPGSCEFCDLHPEWQAIRVAMAINFTGESDPKKDPCPSVKFRPVQVSHAWGGNRPDRTLTRYERDVAYDTEALPAEDEQQYPETD